MANFCSQCGKPLAAGANFCNQCGASISQTHQGEHLQDKSATQMADKRSKVLRSAPKRNSGSSKKWVILAVIGLIVVWAYVNMPSSGNKVIASQPAVAAAAFYPPIDQQMVDVQAKAEGDKIILPLNAVLENKFVAFSVAGRNSIFPLLAYVTNDGKIVTAVSVCEPCNSQRFHINGETIVCNSCGTTWNLNTLEALSGGCGKYPPDAIPNVVVGNEIRIDKAAIESWRRRG